MRNDEIDFMTFFIIIHDVGSNFIEHYISGKNKKQIDNRREKKANFRKTSKSNAINY